MEANTTGICNASLLIQFPPICLLRHMILWVYTVGFVSCVYRCLCVRDSTHLLQKVVIRGPVLLVEMSQDAVVSTGLAEVGRGQCVHCWLSLLGRVGRAVGGRLDRQRRDSENWWLENWSCSTAHFEHLHFHESGVNSISWGRSRDLIETHEQPLNRLCDVIVTLWCYTVTSLIFSLLTDYSFVSTSTWEEPCNGKNTIRNQELQLGIRILVPLWNHLSFTSMCSDLPPDFCVQLDKNKGKKI